MPNKSKDKAAAPLTVFSIDFKLYFFVLTYINNIKNTD